MNHEGEVIMTIDISECDSGRGCLISTHGIVTDEVIIDSLFGYLNQNNDTLAYLRYILFDNSDLTKLDIDNDSIEKVTEQWANISTIHPDIFVGIVLYFSMNAGIEQIRTHSQIQKMFLHRSGWESLLFRTRMEAVRWIRKKVSERYGIVDLTFH